MLTSSNLTVLKSCLSEVVSSTSMFQTSTQTEKPLSLSNLTKSKPIKSTNWEASISTLPLTSLSSKKKDKTDLKKKSRFLKLMPFNSKCTCKNQGSPYKKLSKASKMNEPSNLQSDKENLQFTKENRLQKRPEPQFQNQNHQFNKENLKR